VKWKVIRDLCNKPPEVVEAESAYANPVGVLVFMKKAAPLAPPGSDAPGGKKKKPGKPVTVAVRGFAPGNWDDYILVDE